MQKYRNICVIKLTSNCFQWCYAYRISPLILFPKKCQEQIQLYVHELYMITGGWDQFLAEWFTTQTPAQCTAQENNIWGGFKGTQALDILEFFVPSTSKLGRQPCWVDWARRSNRTNQVRTSFICTPGVPIRLCFNRQQGPLPLSGLSGWSFRKFRLSYIYIRRRSKCYPNDSRPPLFCLVPGPLR